MHRECRTRIDQGVAVVRCEGDVNPVCRILLKASREGGVCRKLFIVCDQMLTAVQNAVAVIVHDKALKAVVRRIVRRDRRHQALCLDRRETVTLICVRALLRDICLKTACRNARVHVRGYLGRIVAQGSVVAREIGELHPLTRVSVVLQLEIHLAGRHGERIAVRCGRILEATADTCRRHSTERLIVAVKIAVDIRELLIHRACDCMRRDLLREEDLQCRVQAARIHIVHNQRNTGAVRRAVHANLDILVRHDGREQRAGQILIAYRVDQVIDRRRIARHIAVDDRKFRGIIAERRIHRIADLCLREVALGRIRL